MILRTLAFIGLITVIIIVSMILIALWDMWRGEEMTNQETDRIECAIRHIQTAVDVDPWAVEIAVEAMRKQIPKKPTVPVDTWLCPSCGEPVEYQQKLGDNVLYHGQHDFCPKCGQAIEWEENEE